MHNLEFMQFEHFMWIEEHNWFSCENFLWFSCGIFLVIFMWNDFHINFFLWISSSCEIHVIVMFAWKIPFKKSWLWTITLVAILPMKFMQKCKYSSETEKNQIVGLGEGIMFDCILTDIQTSCYYSILCWLSANDFFC